MLDEIKSFFLQINIKIIDNLYTISIYVYQVKGEEYNND